MMGGRLLFSDLRAGMWIRRKTSELAWRVVGYDHSAMWPRWRMASPNLDPGATDEVTMFLGERDMELDRWWEVDGPFVPPSTEKVPKRY